MVTALLRTGAIVALGASPLFARDTARAGYGIDATRALSPITALASYDTLSNGDRVVFDGSQAWIEADDGTVLAFLGATPAPYYPSLVEVDPTETYALIGESSNGTIYRAALTGGGLVPFSQLTYNYDLAFEPSGATAIVSAASCGGSCGNRIHRLDLATGATTLIASVAGPSGPLALAANGDLYYATQSDVFPTPAGAVDVIRWTAAQVAAGPFPLTEAQSTTFRANLDGGASIVVDPTSGHVFVAEASYLVVSRVIELDRSGAFVGVVADAIDFASRIEIFDQPGSGRMARFQPPGARIQYRTTNFDAGTSQIVRLTPRRPTLTGVQNPNDTMTLTLEGVTPNSTAFLIVSPNAFQSPTQNAFDLGTYVLWTTMPYPSNIRRAGNVLVADATGRATYTFPNPGSIQGTRVLQALVRDESGVFRGSSNLVTN